MRTGKSMGKSVMIALLALALMLSGCGWEEDPYRIDTVVRIPMNPEESRVWEPSGIPTLPEETQGKREPIVVETMPIYVPPLPTIGWETEDRWPSRDQDAVSRGTRPPATQPKETEPAAAEPEKETQPEVVMTIPPLVTDPPATESSLYDISGYTVEALAWEILGQINQLRAGEGTAELSLDPFLSAIASCRGCEVSLLWSHTRPDGRDYATVLTDYGYSTSAVAELLAYTDRNGNGASVTGQWVASESHRNQLLDTAWSRAGIGIYSTDGYVYICVLLAC